MYVKKKQRRSAYGPDMTYIYLFLLKFKKRTRKIRIRKKTFWKPFPRSSPPPPPLGFRKEKKRVREIRISCVLVDETLSIRIMPLFHRGERHMIWDKVYMISCLSGGFGRTVRNGHHKTIARSNPIIPDR